MVSTNEDLKHNFEKIIRKAKSQQKIDWEKISIPNEFKEYDDTKEDVGAAETKNLLRKIAIVKLNGGLGTSMGCCGPKSMLRVRGEDSFLSLIVKQIKNLNDTYNVDIPFCLMNSLNTDDDTKGELSRIDEDITLEHFMQSTYPRLQPNTFEPLRTGEYSKENAKFWYPPGHGDLYFALKRSGVLRRLKDRGIEYLFVSNVDNLGATMDLRILNHIVDHRIDFLMEVTKKTLLDVKGGTVVCYEDQLMLLEAAQVEEQYMDQFQSIDKFKVFNTNNIWLSVDALQQTKHIDLPVIFNKKKIDNLIDVVQLETAMGAALNSFPNSNVLCVPRSRFIPVKKTSDLFLLRSNLYNIDRSTGSVSRRDPSKQLPIIRFSPQEYQHLKDFESRFPSGIPDISRLSDLSIRGNIVMNGDCVLQGKLLFDNQRNNKLLLEDQLFIDKDYIYTNNNTSIDVKK